MSTSIGTGELESRPLIRRVNFNLSEAAYSEIAQLSSATGLSLPDIFALGIGLVSLVHQTKLDGNALLIATPEGEAVKEVTLAGLLRK
jgi:hypothetical protein